MVLVIGEKVHESRLAAVDSSGALLTAVETQKAQLDAGDAFGAVASQFILLEAVLFLYLRLRWDALGEDSSAIPDRLTFGGTKNLLLKNAALHDEEIEPDLVEYVRRRNRLAHELIVRFDAIDLRDTFDIGVRLTEKLLPYVRKRAIGALRGRTGEQ